MKKTLFAILLLLPSITSLAQLKVYSDGSVTIDRDTAFATSRFTVGAGTPFTSMTPPAGTNNIGILANTQIEAGKLNYGIAGGSVATTATTGRAYGVLGAAGNCTSGYNYGVLGALLGTANGAAVYGSVTKPSGSLIPGRYAGYFLGDAVVTGTATITSLNTPSDIRLKENVKHVGTDEGRADIHSRLKDVHVISYNLKLPCYDEEEAEEAAGEAARRTHYGVSAQELRELFPDLVEEGQDGYLSVNYMELIPMLICSVQELSGEVERLNRELDAMEGES